MLLPEGVERKDTKHYEEVNIPVSEPPPTSVGSKLVPIDSLDEVDFFYKLVYIAFLFINSFVFFMIFR